MTTILCAEDEPVLRESISEDLEEAGYTVIQASDGQEALDLTLERQPDLIVTDITMPVVDGYGLVCALRENHPDFAEIPVIFLSALADRNHILQGMQTGADDYLTKPVDFDMLRTRIEAKLRMSCRMREKKEREQVKLYRALGHQSDSPQERNWPTLEPQKIVLVGRGDDELWGLRGFLEKLGQKLHVFTSGSSYLCWLESGKVNADLTLIWFHTDDMQAPMIRKMASRASGRYVLVVPEKLSRTDYRKDCSNFSAILEMPFDGQGVVELLQETN